MAFAPFVPLRVFSGYTMLEGAIDPKAIAKLARERGFPAIAICDRNGLYGSAAFAAACRGSGIQPIIGTLLAVSRGEPAPGKDPAIDWLALFAQDEAGWLNLCHLVSRAHLDRPLEFDPHVVLSDLEGHSDGLIALTAAGEGALARLYADGKADAAEAYCERLQDLFGDRLYIEIARRGDPVEDASEEALIDLAYARDLPLVATNPASYAQPGFHAAHDAMLCIAHSTHIDAADRVRSSPEIWVKSAPMMEELFADLPEATANSLVIAQRCAFAPPKRKPILPSLAGDKEGEERMMAADAREGLAKRLEPYGELSAEERKVYEDRLEFEVGLTDRLQTAFYLNFSAKTLDEGAARVSEFEWGGISSEWKYKLMDPVADAVGMALYVEGSYATHESELEAKIIVDKQFGSVLLAFNAVFEHEWVFEEKGETEREMAVELDLGLAYQFSPAFSAGIEVRNHNEMVPKEGLEAATLFAGPVVAYSTERWWGALSVMPQLPALKTEEEGTLELEDHEKLNARLILGFHL